MKDPELQNIAIRTKEGVILREAVTPPLVSTNYAEIENRMAPFAGGIVPSGTVVIDSASWLDEYGIIRDPRPSEHSGYANRHAYRKDGSSKGVAGKPGRPKRNKDKVKQQRAARKRK